ncbi:MAG: hypothetical protein GQ532_03935 [Methylomarinum sp.]|nr:hypothetical protein [Methylomarinum sp.]
MQVNESNQDQIELLKQLLSDTPGFSGENRLFTAWAAVFALGSEQVQVLIEENVDKPDDTQLKSIKYAVHRMGVTNPYFIARTYVEVQSGGTLNALGFRPLQELGVTNETAYHCACVAVSLINGGFMCLRSHVESLQQSGASDELIDAVMRLAAVCHSLRSAAYGG